MTLRDRILSVFSDSAFRAPVLKLLSGTGVAFIVAYLANIVLLRLYPDEFWGVADYIIAWVSILAPVASLRYEDALMLPKDRRQAAHAFILAIAAVLVSATLLFTFLALSDSALAFFEEKKAGRWMLLVPLALMANRFAKISELWLSRQESLWQYFCRPSSPKYLHGKRANRHRPIYAGAWWADLGFHRWFWTVHIRYVQTSSTDSEGIPRTSTNLEGV